MLQLTKLLSRQKLVLHDLPPPHVLAASATIINIINIVGTVPLHGSPLIAPPDSVPISHQLRGLRRGHVGHILAATRRRPARRPTSTRSSRDPTASAQLSEGATDATRIGGRGEGVGRSEEEA